MSQDPSSFFGSLYNFCIRDDFVGDEKLAREGALLVILGIGSSVLTAYGLTLLRTFV